MEIALNWNRTRPLKGTVRTSLNRIVNGDIMTQQEIADKMVSVGYKSKSYYQNLLSLINSGVISRRKINGVWHYA